MAATGSERKRQPKAKNANGQPQRRNRQQEVTDAAIRIFWEKGYSAASVQDVADAVGVLKGSLYYYIDSKEDLLLGIFAESHRQASEIVAEAAAAEGGPLDRLGIYVERYVRWYLDNVERVSLYFRDWRYLTGDARARVVEERATYRRFVQKQVTEARELGELPETLDLRLSVLFVLGAINSVSDWYRGGGPHPPGDIAETFRRMAIASLNAPAADD